MLVMDPRACDRAAQADPSDAWNDEPTPLLFEQNSNSSRSERQTSMRGDQSFAPAAAAREGEPRLVLR
jgi:hypothetical protein